MLASNLWSLGSDVWNEKEVEFQRKGAAGFKQGKEDCAAAVSSFTGLYHNGREQVTMRTATGHVI